MKLAIFFQHTQSTHVTSTSTNLIRQSSVYNGKDKPKRPDCRHIIGAHAHYISDPFPTGLKASRAPRLAFPLPHVMPSSCTRVQEPPSGRNDDSISTIFPYNSLIMMWWSSVLPTHLVLRENKRVSDDHILTTSGRENNHLGDVFRRERLAAPI